MLARHALTDAEWERIEHLLPGRPGQTGWLAKDNRLFLDAVLYVGRTGIPWRDLPERFGNWNSVWKRFSRLSQSGVFEAFFEAFAALSGTAHLVQMFDSTIVRAHVSAAGAKGGKKVKRSGAREVASRPKSTSRQISTAIRSASI